MNLLFTLNRNYIPILKNCIKSIVRFKTTEGYNIYIMQSDWEKSDVANLNNTFPFVNFHFVSIDTEIFKDFPENKRYPKEMYYRILAAYILPDTIDKILYLDPDIIVIKPLDNFYSTKLDNNFFAACSHTKKFLTAVNRIRLGIDENCPYINSGVMLMNLKLLREKQNIQDIINYVNEKSDAFILPDQDIITALYGKKTLIADTMKYNLSDRLITMNNAIPGKEKIDISWVKNNTVIIHYYGKNKPWSKNYRGILNCFYDEIEKA